MPTAYQPTSYYRGTGSRPTGLASERRLIELAARYERGEPIFAPGERDDSGDFPSPALRDVSGWNGTGPSDAGCCTRRAGDSLLCDEGNEHG